MDKQMLPGLFWARYHVARHLLLVIMVDRALGVTVGIPNSAGIDIFLGIRQAIAIRIK
jgi:hypothetical protein